jgi:hypothetical protein
MKQLKLILFFVPWILLLLALLLWSMGINPWGRKKSRSEIINTTTILQKIEDLGKIELVRFNYNEIYDYQALSSGKLNAITSYGYGNAAPDLKVALIARGEVAGCIDLRKISQEDVNVRRDTVWILLPSPEICYHKLDMDNTHIYDFERKGWWSRLFPDDNETRAVIEKAYQQAESQILQSAIRDGILGKTSANADLILKPLLEQISGRKVVITFQPSNLQIGPGLE